MDPKEIGLCWDLLDWAAASADQMRNNSRYVNRVAKAVWSAQRFSPFSEASKLIGLPDRTKGRLAFPSKRSLLLEADTKGQWKLPVLKVSHDRVGEHEVIRYQVCLMVLDADQGIDVEVAGTIGLRFEMPEGPTGKHSYYHAQWCRHFHDLENYAFDGCPPWLPDVHPAIPVVANGPLSLMVAMFVSLYGGDFAKRLAREVGSIRRQCDSDESLKKLLG